jgi:hypothetical protein
MLAPKSGEKACKRALLLFYEILTLLANRDLSQDWMRNGRNGRFAAKGEPLASFVLEDHGEISVRSHMGVIP